MLQCMVKYGRAFNKAPFPDMNVTIFKHCDEW